MALASEAEPRHMGTFWVLPLTESTPATVAPRVPATFEQASSEAGSLLAQAMEMEDPTSVLERFATGRRCYIARVAGALAAYGWVSFVEEGIGEIGLSLHLQPGEAYIWDCATLPAYRGQRLYPALLTYIIGKLRAEGRERVWIGASHENVSSHKGMQLAGFQPVVDLLLRNHHLWLQGYPGVSSEVIEAMRRALLGKKHRM
jgi:ribosomal protein S18 acetylase RimI-like enzyme